MESEMVRERGGVGDPNYRHTNTGWPFCPAAERRRSREDLLHFKL